MSGIVKERTDRVEPGAKGPSHSPQTTWGFRLLGVGLAAVVCQLLGGADLSQDGRVVAAVGTLMAVGG